MSNTLLYSGFLGLWQVSEVPCKLLFYMRRSEEKTFKRLCLWCWVVSILYMLAQYWEVIFSSLIFRFQLLH